MKKLCLSLAVVMMAITGPLSALAQNETTQTRTEQRVPVEFTETRGQLIRNRCTTLAERAGQIASALSANQTRSASLTGSLKTKLGEFADKAESAGLDVSQLRTDLIQMDTLANNLSSSWQALIDALGEIRQSASCQSEDLNVESVHAAIEEAKDAKVEVKQSLSALKEFVKTTIKDDLADIRQQLANSNQEEN